MPDPAQETATTKKIVDDDAAASVIGKPWRPQELQPDNRNANALLSTSQQTSESSRGLVYSDPSKLRVKFADKITAVIESEIQGAMGVDMKDFQPELAAPIAEYAASLIVQDKQTSLNTQANLTSDKILKLLKDSD